MEEREGGLHPLCQPPFLPAAPPLMKSPPIFFFSLLSYHSYGQRPPHHFRENPPSPLGVKRSPHHENVYIRKRESVLLELTSGRRVVQKSSAAILKFPGRFFFQPPLLGPKVISRFTVHPSSSFFIDRGMGGGGPTFFFFFCVFPPGGHYIPPLFFSEGGRDATRSFLHRVFPSRFGYRHTQKKNQGRRERTVQQPPPFFFF